jgi:hypothetical protein
MFIFLDFSLNTSRAIKKERVKISKPEYAVFMYYKKIKIEKSSKFEEVMVQNQKKKPDFKWNTPNKKIIGSWKKNLDMPTFSESKNTNGFLKLFSN